MFAVLTMQSEVGLDQWLLISPTAGVGGSQLSRESAAGVTIMGTAWGYYTFFAHLKKWTWTIAPSIWIHFLSMPSQGTLNSKAATLWMSGLYYCPLLMVKAETFFTHDTARKGA